MKPLHSFLIYYVKVLVQLNLPTKSGLLDLTDLPIKKNLPIVNYKQMSQFSIIHFPQGLSESGICSLIELRHLLH